MKRPKKPQFNLAKPREFFTDEVFVRWFYLKDNNEIDITQFKHGYKYLLEVESSVDFWDEVQWNAFIGEYSTGERKNPQYELELASYNNYRSRYEAELTQYNIDITLWNNYNKEQGLKKAQAEKDKKEANERKLFEELRKKYGKENQNP